MLSLEIAKTNGAAFPIGLPEELRDGERKDAKQKVVTSAARAKRMREAQVASNTRNAVNLVVDTLRFKLERLHNILVEVHEGGGDAIDALSLTELCQAEVEKIGSKGPSNYDEFVEASTPLGSLVRAMAAVYGEKDDFCAKTIASVDTVLDVAFEMIEIMDMQEVAA